MPQHHRARNLVPDTRITLPLSTHIPPSAVVRCNFILDACFVIGLEALEEQCRQTFPLKSLKELPLHGLKHFMKHGCNLVIPNEVVKEIFTDRVQATRLGLSLKPNDTVYLDKELLKQSKCRSHFKSFLLDNFDNIYCFPSADAYCASPIFQQSNHIVIIADNGRDSAKPMGLEHRTTDMHGKWGHGDESIRSLAKQLPPLPTTALFTNDIDLQHSVMQCEHPMRSLFLAGYLDALHYSGYTASAQPFNTALRASAPNRNIPNALSNKNAEPLMKQLGLAVSRSIGV